MFPPAGGEDNLFRASDNSNELSGLLSCQHTLWGWCEGWGEGRTVALVFTNSIFMQCPALLTWPALLREQVYQGRIQAGFSV